MPLMIGGDITEKQFLDESFKRKLRSDHASLSKIHNLLLSQSKKYSWPITAGPPN
jgi:hypothetical protein